MAQTVKNLPVMRETQVHSLGLEGPLEKGMATHSKILPEEFHGQRNLVGYSPWGRRETPDGFPRELYNSLSPFSLNQTCGSLHMLHSSHCEYYYSDLYPYLVR